MGGSALPHVLPAVYAALNVGALTGTLGCAVYDDVPQRAPYPYVVLQSPTEHRVDRMRQTGKALTLQAHVYTSTDAVEGIGQVAAIVSTVTELLEYAALNLSGSGWQLTFCRVEDVMDAGDVLIGGVTVKHLIGMIRIEVQPV